MGRVGLAFRCFFRVLGGKPVPSEVAREESDEPLALPPGPPELSDEEKIGRSVQLIGLLQKEGRLLDFIQENIDDYDDGQVGAAVRSIHRDCHKVLAEYLKLEPVVQGEEESDYEVPAGFDPSQIRVIGNVTGDPPFTGLLRHHGWRASNVGLPEPAKGVDPTVIAPAEVELS